MVMAGDAYVFVRFLSKCFRVGLRLRPSFETGPAVLGEYRRALEDSICVAVMFLGCSASLREPQEERKVSTGKGCGSL